MTAWQLELHCALCLPRELRPSRPMSADAAARSVRYVPAGVRCQLGLGHSPPRPLGRPWMRAARPLDGTNQLARPAAGPAAGAWSRSSAGAGRLHAQREYSRATRRRGPRRRSEAADLGQRTAGAGQLQTVGGRRAGPAGACIWPATVHTRRLADSPADSD